MTDNNIKKSAKSTSKATNANFFDEPYIDALMRINTELLTELWVVKDRLYVLEKILIEKSFLNNTELDNHVPKEDFLKFLDDERDKLIKRVIESPFREEDNRTVKSILSLSSNKKNN